MKPEIPEVRQAVIQSGELLDLFRDVELLCELESLRLRGRSDEDERTLTFEEARALVHSGLPGAIQIRYRYEESDWIDTLTPQADGYHLTRIAL